MRCSCADVRSGPTDVQGDLEAGSVSGAAGGKTAEERRRRWSAWCSGAPRLPSTPTRCARTAKHHGIASRGAVGAPQLQVYGFVRGPGYSDDANPRFCMRHDLAAIDVSAARGLEIGPLMNPRVRKGDGAVFYLDHVSTEELREKYKNATTSASI